MKQLDRCKAALHACGKPCRMHAHCPHNPPATCVASVDRSMHRFLRHGLPASPQTAGFTGSNPIAAGTHASGRYPDLQVLMHRLPAPCPRSRKHNASRSSDRLPPTAQASRAQQRMMHPHLLTVAGAVRALPTLACPLHARPAHPVPVYPECWPGQQ